VEGTKTRNQQQRTNQTPQRSADVRADVGTVTEKEGDIEGSSGPWVQLSSTYNKVYCMENCAQLLIEFDFF
jgi:hypothetical protein